MVFQTHFFFSKYTFDQLVNIYMYKDTENLHLLLHIRQNKYSHTFVIYIQHSFTAH